MADKGTTKSEAENLDAKEEQRVEERHIAERNEDKLESRYGSGTHDSTRRGVAWGPSYQVRSTAIRKSKKKDEPKRHPELNNARWVVEVHVKNGTHDWFRVTNENAAIIGGHEGIPQAPVSCIPSLLASLTWRRGTSDDN